MAAIAGYQGALLTISFPSVTLGADYALTDSGDHKTYNNPAANATQRYWDPTSPPVIQTSVDGSTWLAALAGTTIRYTNGQVVLPVALTGTAQVRLHSGGKSFPYALVANITQWLFDGMMAMAENTVMTGAIGGGGGSAFKTFQPTLLEGTMQITKWWVPETSEGYVADLVQGTYVLFSGVAGTGNRYEGFGYVKKLGIKTDVQKLTDMPIEVQFDGTFVAV